MTGTIVTHRWQVVVAVLLEKMVTEDPPKEGTTKDANGAPASADASGKQLNSAKVCPPSATAAAEAGSQGGSRATSTAMTADAVLPVEQGDKLDVAQELLVLRSDMAVVRLERIEKIAPSLRCSFAARSQPSVTPSRQIRHEMAGMKDVQIKLAVALDALVNQLQDGGLAADALAA